MENIFDVVQECAMEIIKDTVKEYPKATLIAVIALSAISAIAAKRDQN